MPGLEEGSFHSNDSVKTVEDDSFGENSRRIGAKILSQTNFENRHKEITDSSYKKALEKDESLDARPSERRNLAYILRLENLVDKYGNQAEQRIWRKSANKLIINPEDIPDSYWRRQEQILRDNGRDDVIDDDYKDVLVHDIRKNQKDSLSLWSNYLGDKNTPYPMWFKIYAWDGMSKMGVYDREKKCFTKRDKSTVAPYPKLNPSALTKVYDTIRYYYGGEESDSEIDTKINADYEALIKSGSFNKLYSKMLLSEKKPIKTPENPDEIRGEWVEYLPGDEEKLAEAAENTPWCITSTYMGRGYLHSNQSSEDNKAKFLLFHLTNPETGLPSDTACASIRLNTEGKVEEISGLGEEQALEDSLVPTVLKKARTLPGGEEFLEAFADKQMLISLDRKMKNGEELTREEYEFIYEINKPINTLGTYESRDPRVDELREKYNIMDALNAGVDVTKLISHLDNDDLIQSVGALTAHGASIDNIVSILPPDVKCDNLERLNKYGANLDIKQLVRELPPEYIVGHLDLLSDNGINVDCNRLIEQLDEDVIQEHIEDLVAHDVDINRITAKLGKTLREVFSEMEPKFIATHLEKFIQSDIDMNDIINYLDSHDTYGKQIGLLLDNGVDQDLLINSLDRISLSLYLEDLLEHNVDAGKILPRIDGFIIMQGDNCRALVEHGINIDDLVDLVGDSIGMFDVLRVLVENGADVNKILPKLNAYDLKDSRTVDLLRQHGVKL